MAGWAGFSDEELRRLQNKDMNAPAVSGRGQRIASVIRSHQQVRRERALQVAIQQNGSGPLLPDQQLIKPKVQSTVPSQDVQKTPQAKETHQEPVKTSKEPQIPTTGLEMDNQMLSANIPVAKELNKQEVKLREKSRLEQLQVEQKMMEEKNKRKKALLTKTIAEKSKRTQAEAVKLKRIQRELQALDDLVSSDIGILRGRIEQASWDYSIARKRYEKAEVEFVAAKLDLHKKTELKEQLTEHLYAIIQQNEKRKALKLEELMKQLEVQTDDEQLELEIQVEKMLEEVEAQGEKLQVEAAAIDGGPDAILQQEMQSTADQLPEAMGRDPICKNQDASPVQEPVGQEAVTSVL
ncbi:RAB6-interacting golgin [Arapaima gigas]